MSRYVKFGELVELEKSVASHNEKSVASHNESCGYKAINIATSDTEVARKIATSNNVASHIKTVASHKRKDRHKTGRVQLNSRINPDIKKKIKHFCADTGIQLQDFIELVASHFFECVAIHKDEKVAIKLAHDDLMIRKTNDDIIMLYQRYTGNKWKPPDDRAAHVLNNVDRRIIEIGLLNTLLNARGRRINSFAYFLPEIQTLIEINLHKESIDVYLERRRQQWQSLGNQRTQEEAEEK